MNAPQRITRELPGMTEAQKAWLDAHPDYRPLGQTGGFHIFTKRGTLRPDGTFARVTKASPIGTANGAFGVGVLTDLREGQPAPTTNPGAGFQRSAAVAKTPPPPDPNPTSQPPPPGPLPRKV